ncbi:arylsulfatase A-like enzyme [Haloferula luteola]|uniref:Arylsulfatase A-like enzyme n=1 Tax=Haloferula luteola TaxID=595692 RepID=A0A840UY90_9BACT|nr:arylsulfatase [Haloferula luteola]MBB5350705.1 arylsulfatase A-like enzyme [Haloferula luteola]
MISVFRYLGLLGVISSTAWADMALTNGDFEGPEFFTNSQTGTTSRDGLFYEAYATHGDGWYNSNNPTHWNLLPGGPSGSVTYGAKDSSTNLRSLLHVITDNRQTTGVVKLQAKVLYRASGGNEKMVIKAWGVRENTPGQWDGWVDQTGPLGNPDALDVRDFNSALSPDATGQQLSGDPVSYTGSDFTPLLSQTAASLGLAPAEVWQDVFFELNLGDIGYDQIVLGVSFAETSGTRSGVDELKIVPRPSAELTVTNGDFEGTELFAPTLTDPNGRDSFFRDLYAQHGDGWYTSNNPDSTWTLEPGGAGDSPNYGGKRSSGNHRGIVHVITDERQHTGPSVLHVNLLHRPNGGSENLIVKIWGIRETVPGKWDGWIDLTGPSGNTHGLDLRDFNTAIPPGDPSQTSTTSVPNYTGSDFTTLLVTSAAGLGISSSEDWQPAALPFDLGDTGYDQIVVGFAYQATTGKPSGVDDLSPEVTMPLDFTFAASPTKPTFSDDTVSFTWGHSNPIENGIYHITSSLPGQGPWDVTALTIGDPEVTSSEPFSVPYDPEGGDVTYTLAIADPETGRTYRKSITLIAPRPEPTLSVTPDHLDPGQTEISLTWSTLGFPTNGQVVITTNRTTMGPIDVTSMTDSQGASTSPLVIPYDSIGGDVEITLTVTHPISGVTGTTRQVVSASSGDLPNVLVVLVDDMGWSDISPYGGEIQTPTLQRLADHGLRFRDFHNEGRCAPTRNALLSGLHVQTSATKPNNNLPAMRIDNNVTIAEMLRTAGYRTYISGKWHISEYQNQADYTPLSSPTHRGFDYAFNASLWGGNLADNHALGYWNPAEYDLCPADSEILPIRYDGTDPRATLPFFQTDAKTDYALEYLNHHYGKGDDKPFFLYVAYGAPHFHLSAPKELIDRYTDIADAHPEDEDIYRYEDGWEITRQRRFDRQLAEGVIRPGTRLSPPSPNPDNGNPIPQWDSLSSVEKDDLSRRMALYAAMVDNIDDNLARILSKLEAEGELDNTVILFMSDNGGNAEQGLFGGGNRQTGTALAEMGQPGQANLWIGGAWANVSNTPYRYFKHHTHEGGTRTPLIAHWPAGIPHSLDGSWTDERGHVIDVLPTLLDIAGIRYPETFHGHNVEPAQGTSLVPVFQGARLAPRDLMIEHERNRALYRGDWKLVSKTFTSPQTSDLPGNVPELYNLKNDPTEMNNLAFHEPAMLAEMATAFNHWVDLNEGLDANRKLALPAIESAPFIMPRGREFLVDDFNRTDSDDLDANQSGLSGRLIGMNQQPLHQVYLEGHQPAGMQIVDKQLRISGQSSSGVAINLDDPLTHATGGYSVGFDLVTAPQEGDDLVGLAIGLTEIEATAGGIPGSLDAFSAPDKAEYFADLTASGQLNLRVQGETIASIQVGAVTGRWLFAVETAGGFHLGDGVTVKVFFNGSPIHQSTFNWSQADSSRLGITASSRSFVAIDNLIVAPLPLLESFIGPYALDSGLLEAHADPDADPDQDGVTTAGEWLLGTHPGIADNPTQGALAIWGDSPNGPALLMRRAAGYLEAGIPFQIRYSTDLTRPVSQWSILSDEETQVLSEQDGYQTVAMTLPPSLRGLPHLFCVLQVD